MLLVVVIGCLPKVYGVQNASAIVYSITETALLNGLKPYNYLTYILDEIRKMGVFPEPEEMDKLLPWSKDLPDEVRTKCKK